MECHDVRTLWTFAQRDCEHLDALEREVLAAHLEKCPDCAALSDAEHRLDETLGKVMRDVPVPSGLHAGVLAKLDLQRRPRTWTRAAAAAAAVLLLVGGTLWLTARESVTLHDVSQLAETLHRKATAPADGWNTSNVEGYFQERGLDIEFPGKMDPQYLVYLDIVEFKNLRVAKLSLRGDRARAEVIVLPHRQFRTEDLPDEGGDAFTNFRIEKPAGAPFTYLILYSGDLSSLHQREV